MAKTLIAYFSHAGQNYSRGGIRHLDVGNTQVAAEKLHAMTGGDLFYIDTVQKYPADHMEKIAVAKAEFEANARPELTGQVENMDQYDAVILAFPNWWTTMPMALFTFLESYDFAGKIICPLVTHGGSGFSNALKDIARLCPGAAITEGLAINGDDVGCCDKTLAAWLGRTGLV